MHFGRKLSNLKILLFEIVIKTNSQYTNLCTTYLFDQQTPSWDVDFYGFCPLPPPQGRSHSIMPRCFYYLKDCSYINNFLA